MTRSQISIAVSLGLAIAAGSSPAGAWSCTRSIAQCQIEGANKENIVEKWRAAAAAPPGAPRPRRGWLEGGGRPDDSRPLLPPPGFIAPAGTPAGRSFVP